MPINLVKIASNRAQCEFYEGEDICHITYYPGRITEKVLSVLSGFSSEDMTPAAVEAGFASFNAMLAHLLAEWDVYEDREETIMFPIEASRFDELPMPFRMNVFNAIMADLRPEAKTARRTRNSSR